MWRGSRRDWMALGAVGAVGAAATLLTPRWASGLGRSSKLVFALLDHGAGSNPRPTALRRLSWEIVKRTSIEAELESVILPLDAPELYYHPFAVLTGEQGFEAPTDAEVAHLRRYLTYGGLLLVDDTRGDPEGPFARSARALLARVLPGRPLRVVPGGHVVYKTFYLLDGPAGRTRARPFMEGIQVDNRYAVFYSHNDLLGAWARDDLGMWQYDVDARRREQSFRLGVNLVMYSMCLDYKDDQVHLPFILKRRKS